MHEFVVDWVPYYLATLADVLTQPSWVWIDVRFPCRRIFVNSYGPLFEGSRNRLHFWTAVEFTVGIVTAAASGLLFSEEGACQAIVGCVGCVSVAMTIVLLFVRPYDTLLDTLQAVVGNALTSVAAGIAFFVPHNIGLIEQIVWAQSAMVFLSLGLSVGCLTVQLWADGGTMMRRGLLGVVGKLVARVLSPVAVVCGATRMSLLTMTKIRKNQEKEMPPPNENDVKMMAIMNATTRALGSLRTVNNWHA